MVGPEIQNHVLANYEWEFELHLVPHFCAEISQESMISMDSSVLRHFGFFELGSVAFSNFKSIHPFDDNLPDHEWK